MRSGLRRGVAIAACLGLPCAAQAATRLAEAQAAFDRAVSYDLGSNGGVPDPRAALDGYLQAAAAELPLAQLNAALMLDSGRGTPRDATRAAALYAAAAAHGQGRAAFDLAQLYEEGDGVPRNAAAARAWFAFAAQHGVAAAIGRPVTTGELPADMPGASGLRAASPIRPRGDILAPLGQEVALVWTDTPQSAQAGATTTYLQVLSNDAGTQHVLFQGAVPATAATVKLPAGRRDYAWRTLTVSPVTGHYVPSAWATFTATIEADDRPGR